MDVFAANAPAIITTPGVSIIVITTTVVTFLSWLLLLFRQGATTGTTTSPPLLVLEKENAAAADNNNNATNMRVPFVAVGEPDWSTVMRAMEVYNQDVSRMLNGLSKSLGVVIASEYELWGRQEGPQRRDLLQDALRHQISKLAHILEQDAKVLETVLLQPFPTIQVLADQPHWIDEQHPEQCKAFHADCNETVFLPRFSKQAQNDAASYDSAAQVVAHMVRDWTNLGKDIRRSTYEWCRTQLVLSHSFHSDETVLVPGAGLGRLAYDLMQAGFHVQANDSSWIMAAAAHAVLSNNAQGILHPFAMDYFVNEVDSEQRYEGVSFPDIQIDNRHDGGKQKQSEGSLSFTIGDFVQVYSAPYARDVYGAVVTCFFIDTATNIYEYLVTVHNLLKKNGGVWINVGPVQWHQNALVRPSVSQLRLMMTSMGFQILTWSVDDTPVNYRHDENFHEKVRSTKYEAYRPLRFVAVLREDHSVRMAAPASVIINNLGTRGQSTATVTDAKQNPLRHKKSEHISLSRPSSSAVHIEELEEETD